VWNPVGPASTAFEWAHASWDNAETWIPRSNRGEWRGRYVRSISKTARTPGTDKSKPTTPVSTAAVLEEPSHRTFRPPDFRQHSRLRHAPLDSRVSAAVGQEGMRITCRKGAILSITRSLRILVP